MQEVIGSTPIFSTQQIIGPDIKQFSDVSGPTGVKPLTKFLNCHTTTIDVAIPDKLYTTPILSKGAEIKSVPKGSTKLKEQAKQKWCIDFSYLNSTTGKMQRFRPSKEGNKIKDPGEKLNYFNSLLEVYKDLLDGGWNPLDEQNNAKLRQSIVSTTLIEAKGLFEAYHKSKGTRKKSIQTYLSKVNALIAHYGESKKVNEISDYEITSFLNHQEATVGWVGTTYVNAKIALNNFFTFLKKNKYILTNPVTEAETRKKIKTESHKVFSDEDFKLIMGWLKQHDPYALLFCRTIYYTCIRPKELRYLQLKHIDLKKKIIIVPASIAKNKRAEPVHIDESLLAELNKLDLDQYHRDSYLFGSTKNFISDTPIGENTPYNRFHKCLIELNLDKEDYTLYSFKHMSNVKKYIAGWTSAQISKANRHSTISETETYLKDLLKFVEIDKAIPPI